MTMHSEPFWTASAHSWHNLSKPAFKPPAPLVYRALIVAVFKCGWFWMTMHSEPFWTASAHSWHNLSKPAFKPPAPLVYRALIVAVFKCGWFWMTVKSESNKNGLDKETAGASSEETSNKFPLAPKVVSKDITKPSLNGSIAGLVTWANL